MTARRKFSDLVEKMPAESRARVARQVGQTLAGMRLAELRDSLGVTAEMVEAELGVKRAAVTRLAGREDTSVGTLRDYVAALSGELEIVARFAEGTIRIGGADDDGKR